MNESGRVRIEGSCSCSRVSFCLTLPGELGTYAPRACDCDFCSPRGVAYLSHPAGHLTVRHSVQLKHEKQGSEQADFCLCSACGDLVCVTAQYPSGLKGAVNASLLDQDSGLQPAVPASPKHLAPEEKRERWESLWLSVDIEESAPC